MHKKKLMLDNRQSIILVIFLLVLLFVLSILIPFLIINYLALSGIGTFFYDNIIFSLFTVFILFYFMFVGLYYYKINIDPYVVQVSSFRPIFQFFSLKDYVDVPHAMLNSYSFFDRPLSFNKTLVLKIVSNSSKKIIIKRFNLSFLTQKKILKISSLLDRIILNNK
tara:strand:- start:186 stop:683 length:498 start_codon:yes stop_codon:yes gene_type:complete